MAKSGNFLKPAHTCSLSIQFGGLPRADQHSTAGKLGANGFDHAPWAFLGRRRGDALFPSVYESGERRLFDLSTDLGERHDLSAKMAEKTEELDQRLTKYLESVNAQTPMMNASFDPSQPASELRRGGRRGPRRPRDRRDCDRTPRL